MNYVKEESPQFLEKFELLDYAKCGSAGAVMKGRPIIKGNKNAVGRLVALKFLNNGKEGHKSKSGQANHAEIMIHGSLRHKNIPQIYGYYKIGTNSCIAMEYSQYGDMENFKRRVIKRAPLSETLICYILGGLVEAVRYIHTHNKINQTDEILNCKEYLYDYIKEQEIKKQKEEELLKEQQEGNKELKENENNPEVNQENKNEENKEEKEIKEDIEKQEEKKEKENLIEESKEKEKEKEEVIKSKEEIEKENVFKLLEKKSEVLRRYLSENVLPLLSLGILQVATDRPDDPVEALADFLLDKTLEMEKEEDKKKNKKENETDLKQENK